MKTLRIGAAIAASFLAACGSPTPGTDAAGDAVVDGSVVDSQSGSDAAPEAETDGSALDAIADTGSSDAATDSASRPDASEPTLVERATIARRTDACINGPEDFGMYGVITQYDRYSLENPSWIGGTGPVAVQVLVPVGGAATHPVIFYSHAFGGTDWTRVRALLEHWVSQDYVAVFTPYATTNVTTCQRYDTLWGGHSRAVDALGARVGMDTSRVGFVGHSFGGGAVPWLATEAVRARSWGANGLFLMPNAPWFSFRMDAARWALVPAHARLHVMVFNDDDTNDHRIALEDQFTPFPRAKQWVNLRSATNGTCMQVADHIVPATNSTAMDSVRLNGLDLWGVWRHSDALAACAFRNNATACSVIDGSNPTLQTTMGTWSSDRTPVTTAERSDAPTGPMPSSAYTFGVTRRSAFPCDGRGG